MGRGDGSGDLGRTVAWERSILISKQFQFLIAIQAGKQKSVVEIAEQCKTSSDFHRYSEVYISMLKLIKRNQQSQVTSMSESNNSPSRNL